LPVVLTATAVAFQFIIIGYFGNHNRLLSHSRATTVAKRYFLPLPDFIEIKVEFRRIGFGGCRTDCPMLFQIESKTNNSSLSWVLGVQRKFMRITLIKPDGRVELQVADGKNEGSAGWAAGRFRQQAKIYPICGCRLSCTPYVRIDVALINSHQQ